MCVFACLIGSKQKTNRRKAVVSFKQITDVTRSTQTCFIILKYKPDDLYDRKELVQRSKNK